MNEAKPTKTVLTFHISTPEGQRQAANLNLRKAGFVSYIDGDDLVTNATVAQTYLTVGTSSIFHFRLAKSGGPLEKRLWSFNWLGTDGFNQVYAASRGEALVEAEKKWPGHHADPATLKCWDPSEENKYFSSLPLFD